MSTGRTAGRLRFVVLSAALVALLVPAGALAAPAQEPSVSRDPAERAAAAHSNRKITICHRTGSAKNPFVAVSVSANGLNGHGGHGGDLIPMPANGCPKAPPTCGQQGLPCESIPEVPNHLRVVLAVLAAASAWAGATWLGRWRRRRAA